jgi:hypothetical protein
MGRLVRSVGKSALGAFPPYRRPSARALRVQPGAVAHACWLGPLCSPEEDVLSAVAIPASGGGPAPDFARFALVHVGENFVSARGRSTRVLSAGVTVCVVASGNFGAEPLAVRAQRVSRQSERSGLLLLSVDGAKKSPALDCERGLRALGIAKLASRVRVAASFEHTAGRLHGVEIVLGVGERGAGERAQLCEQILGGFIGLVLEHRQVVAAYSSM